MPVLCVCAVPHDVLMFLLLFPQVSSCPWSRLLAPLKCARSASLKGGVVLSCPDRSLLLCVTPPR